MKVKVFYPNKNDKIEFTRKELEELLDEVYNDGYVDGKKAYSWTYTPHITWSNNENTPYHITTTSASTESNDTKLTWNDKGECVKGSCDKSWKY